MRKRLWQLAGTAALIGCLTALAGAASLVALVGRRLIDGFIAVRGDVLRYVDLLQHVDVVIRHGARQVSSAPGTPVGMHASALARGAVILGLVGSVAGCTTVPIAPSCVHRNSEVEQAIGYCQALRSGDDLFISGVTAAAPMEAAVPKVYQTLADILKANGLSFRDVVKENVYATDLDAFIANNDKRKPFFEDQAPSATWVQVQRLFRPAYVLEVELVARYPKGR